MSVAETVNMLGARRFSLPHITHHIPVGRKHYIGIYLCLLAGECLLLETGFQRHNLTNGAGSGGLKTMIPSKKFIRMLDLEAAYIADKNRKTYTESTEYQDSIGWPWKASIEQVEYYLEVAESGKWYD